MSYKKIIQQFKEEYNSGNFEKALQLAADLKESRSYKRFIEELPLEMAKQGATDIPVFYEAICLYRLNEIQKVEDIIKNSYYWKNLTLHNEIEFKDFDIEIFFESVEMTMGKI